MVSTSRCGRDNPGSNPGYSNLFCIFEQSPIHKSHDDETNSDDSDYEMTPTHIPPPPPCPQSIMPRPTPTRQSSQRDIEIEYDDEIKYFQSRMHEGKLCHAQGDLYVVRPRFRPRNFYNQYAEFDFYKLCTMLCE